MKEVGRKLIHITILIGIILFVAISNQYGKQIALLFIVALPTIVRGWSKTFASVFGE